ncbi:MAG: DUF58 domain-containing protein [Phycisphaerae bacterium]
MIAPRNILLWLVGGLGVPLTVTAGLQPQLWPPAALVLLALTAAAMVDAALSIGRLRQARVPAQDVLRLTKDVEGELTVDLALPARPRGLRAALALPEGLECDVDDVPAVPLKTAEDAPPACRFRWEVLPRRRGQYILEAIYLQCASRLGLWHIRRRVSMRREVRVYPNLLGERKTVANLFLPHGRLGGRAVRQVGQGREFEKLRDYITGDSYEDVHWKATAKRGTPVTKVYQIERTQEVYVLIDASRLSARKVPVPDDPRRSEPVLERYVTASLVLGRATERQGDLLGMMTFSDRVDTFLRAAAGREHYRTCRNALYTVHPRPVTPDFSEVCSFVRMHLRRRALLVFLTNLDDPLLAESFLENVKLIGRQHLVVAGMITRPQERPLFTGEMPGTVDDVYRRLGGHLRWAQLAELQRSLRRRGVTLLTMENEKLCPRLVSEYVAVKQRQLI